MEINGLSRFLEGENNLYKDPDYEYALLDDSHSDIQSETSIITNTTITSNLLENDNDKRNFTFTETVTNFINAYMDLKSNDNDNENLDEINIDWLDSEIDSALECIILDYKDGKIQRCSNLRFRPLKQLLGIWELDSQAIDSIFKQNQMKVLETLSICSSYFNFDQDDLYERGMKKEVSIK
ncbi:2901_t:CDS:2 [Ambispora gerdemannii]|uniref:2901_t:CDS:1 n=1 Tax=Ambispora gerdemannii TaxID=144530 RepID=A0A9N9GLX5_9GLOM|nr:2901_t:CDS:2 [Ambispora gerdemannii]